MAAAKSRNARRKFPSADELIRRRLQRWRRVTRLKFARTDDNCQLYWLHDEPYTPPLQRLVASLNPRGSQPRARPRARASHTHVHSGPSPPPGEGNDEGSGGGDGGDDDDGPRVVQVPVGLIRPHPVSQQIYGGDSESRPELVDSIRERGILEPLHLVRRGDTYVVLSGHSRLSAAKTLGFETVPAYVVDVPEEEEIPYLLEANLQRVKSASQRLREALALEPFFRSEALARSRSGRGADGSGGRGKRKTRGTNDPGVSSKPTRDALAARVGLGSGRQLDKLRLIADKRPDLLALIDAGKKRIGGAYAQLCRDERLQQQAELVGKVSLRSDCILGDCCKLLPKVADGSCAAVIRWRTSGICSRRSASRRRSGRRIRWRWRPIQRRARRSPRAWRAPA